MLLRMCSPSYHCVGAKLNIPTCAVPLKSNPCSHLSPCPLSLSLCLHFHPTETSRAGAQAAGGVGSPSDQAVLGKEASFSLQLFRSARGGRAVALPSQPGTHPQGADAARHLRGAFHSGVFIRAREPWARRRRERCYLQFGCGTLKILMIWKCNCRSLKQWRSLC